jgi:hypothetical protein
MTEIPRADSKEIERAAAALESQGASLVAYPFEMLIEGGARKGVISYGLSALYPLIDQNLWPFCATLREEAARALGCADASNTKTVTISVCSNNSLDSLDCFKRRTFSVQENSMPGYKSHPGFKLQIRPRLNVWTTKKSWRL